MLLPQIAILAIQLPIFICSLFFYVCVFAFGFVELKQLKWVSLHIAISSLISQLFLLAQALTISYSRSLLSILSNQVFYYYILIAVLGCYSFYGRLYSLSTWMDRRMLKCLSGLLIAAFIVLLMYNILNVRYLLGGSDMSDYTWVISVHLLTQSSKYAQMAFALLAVCTENPLAIFSGILLARHIHQKRVTDAALHRLELLKRTVEVFWVLEWIALALEVWESLLDQPESNLGAIAASILHIRGIAICFMFKYSLDLASTRRKEPPVVRADVKLSGSGVSSQRFKGSIRSSGVVSPASIVAPTGTIPPDHLPVLGDSVTDYQITTASSIKAASSDKHATTKKQSPVQA